MRPLVSAMRRAIGSWEDGWSAQMSYLGVRRLRRTLVEVADFDDFADKATSNSFSARDGFLSLR
jgi:hypothetical protein